jgi:hypothetical protein
VKVELPAWVGVAVSSVGGWGGSLSMVISFEAMVDSLPAASIAASVRVCVPSVSSVVGSVSVCGPVESGHGRGNVKLHLAS